MPPPNTCPICGLPNVQGLGRRENSAIFGFRCQRCGTYEIAGEALGLRKIPEEKRLRLSVATRAADVLGSPLVIDTSLALEIVEQQLPRRPLLETADIVLLYLADLARSHFATIEYHTSHDHTLLGFGDERGMQDALNALKHLGRLDERATTITIDGWKRIEELRREQPNSHKAFVAMWFAEEMEVAWTEGFELGIRDTEFFEPVRMLDIEHAGKIDNRIIAEIRTSGLLVADFTGDRGGVYYEAGFAAGLGIPVIWCCREDHFDRIHFDTRQYNHILWTEPSDLREKLKNRILAVVPAATKR